MRITAFFLLGAALYGQGVPAPGNLVGGGGGGSTLPLSARNLATDSSGVAYDQLKPSTTSTTLTVLGANAARFNQTTYNTSNITATATAANCTVSSGSATVDGYIFVYNTGERILQVPNSLNLTGCTIANMTVSSVATPAFPSSTTNGAYPIATVPMTSNGMTVAFGTITAARDVRASVGVDTFTCGTGLSCANASGLMTGAIDTAVVPQLGGNNIFTGTDDNRNAAATYPAVTGTSLPATCSTGQQYFKSDATAGQNLYYCTAANTWTQQLAGSGGGTSGWSGIAASLLTTATQYAPFVGGRTTSATGTESVVQVAASATATISNLKISLDAAVGGSATISVTLRDASADTALTCTTSSGGTTCSDTTHGVNVALGDLVDFKIVATGTVTAATPNMIISYAVGTSGVGVTTVSTSGPITGGPITASGTIACATCATFQTLQGAKAAVALAGSDVTISTTTVAIPAGTMGNGGCYSVDATYEQTAASNATTFTLWFGSAAKTGSSLAFPSTTTNTPVNIHAVICNGAASTTAQTLDIFMNFQQSSGGFATQGTGAQNTGTTGMFISISGNSVGQSVLQREFKVQPLFPAI